jgi:hypothetical protein
MTFSRNLTTIFIAAAVLAVAAGARYAEANMLGDASVAVDASRVPQVCGQRSAAPAHYSHIVWILEENRSLTQVMNPVSAPFITALAKQCAYSTKFDDNEPRQSFGAGYHSVVHYIADVAGSNCIEGNGRKGTGCLGGNANNPMAVSVPTESLFQQVTKAGLTWRSYQESAPASCARENHGLYVPRHDAAVYFSKIRTDCQKYDMPIATLHGHPTGSLIHAIETNSLPTFSYITPNLNHDMHNGSVAAGDAWLRSYLMPLFRSQSYEDGQTVVFVIWDEANKSNSSLPNLIIAPTARSGADALPINGFTVLRATENMLGLPYLGCATGVPPGGTGTCYAGASANLRHALSI